MRLNYMGGMSGPGCQRLGAISERVHLSLSDCYTESHAGQREVTSAFSPT